MSRNPDPVLRQRWRDLLDSFEQNRQTVKDFCQHHEISPAALYRWRKRLSEEQMPRLIPVEISPIDFANQSATRTTGLAGEGTVAVVRLTDGTVIEIADGQASVLTDLAVALATLQQERQAKQ